VKTIAIYNIHGRRRVRHRDASDAVRAVLAGEGCRNAEVSVVFVNSRRMIRMNTDFLNHRYDTDVLSFPLSEPDSSKLEGDVYVNLDRAHRQAKEYGEPPRREIARLVIHGVLHLLGHDDRTEALRKRMSGVEDRYLQKVFTSS